MGSFTSQVFSGYLWEFTIFKAITFLKFERSYFWCSDGFRVLKAVWLGDTSLPNSWASLFYWGSKLKKGERPAQAGRKYMGRQK